MRLSADALALLLDAARVQQQSLSAFVLGAAMDRARAVLVDDQVLRLGVDDVVALERMLDRRPDVDGQLLARLRRPRSVRVERPGEPVDDGAAPQDLRPGTGSGAR